MNLLLTGATGFVGRNILLQALRSKRYERIYVLVRSVEKLRTQLGADGFLEMPREIVAITSSAPEWNLENLPGIDHLIHSAGVISAGTWEEYYRTNVEGTLRLFRRLAAPQRAILISSLSAAGPCRNGECRTEEHAERPVTWYGRSKLEMEMAMEKHFPSLRFLALRPPMIFGARDQASLPLFKMVLKPIHFKSGLLTKYYSYIGVGDLTRAVFAALDSPLEWRDLPRRTYFVNSPEPISDRELIAWSAQVSRRRGLLLPVPQAALKALSRAIDSIPTWRSTIPSLSVDRAKEIWPRRWVASSSAFCRAFGWKAEEDFLVTLKESRDWYVRTGQLPV